MYELKKFNSRDLKKRLLLKNVDEDYSAWHHWANIYYSLLYTMYDKTAEERRYLKRLWACLEATIPEPWKNNVVEIRAHGCMGEEVYLVDGILEHTMHRTHRKCMKSRLVRRGEKIWCTECNDYSENADALTGEEVTAIKIIEKYEREGLHDIKKIGIWLESVNLGFHVGSIKFTGEMQKKAIKELHAAFVRLAAGEEFKHIDDTCIVKGMPAWSSAFFLCKRCGSPTYRVMEKPLKDCKRWCQNCKKYSK